MTTTSFETQCIINAINARLNAYEKSGGRKREIEKKNVLNWVSLGEGERREGEGGFYSSIILPIDDLNIDPI